MRQRYMIVLLCTLVWGCIRDYDFEKEVTPRIVVNSILDPDSVIEVDMWWSKKLDNSDNFSRVIGAKVTLYENDAPLFNVTSTDQTISWDYKPKEGATYTITVNYPNQAEIRATTTVPARPQINCTFTKYAGTQWRTYRHYNLTEASIDQHSTALIISYNQRYDTTELGHLKWDEYHLKQWPDGDCSANSIQIDAFNRYYEVENANAKGSAYDYQSMMRIPCENLGNALPLSFSTRDVQSVSFKDEDWWFYPEIYPDDYKGLTVYQTQYITFCAASSDYDLYSKTLLQYRSTDYEANAFMSQVIYRVHTNVENGLGIFAARSNRVLSFTKTEQ